MLWGFKDCLFGQFATVNAQYNSRYQRVSGNLIRLRNFSELVEGSLFATNDLLLGAKPITLCFILSGWGMILPKNLKFQKNKFLLFLLNVFFVNTSP